MTSSTRVPAAVAAFDASADVFDGRFGTWASVAAQRRAVRRHLVGAFPPGARVIELGGGTGDDAIFLALKGRDVLLTDGSARMLHRAAEKADAQGCADRVNTAVFVLEEIEEFAAEWRASGGEPFDGAFSNFAALNCVADLRAVARGLAALLRPGAPALLVFFGPFPPGEVVVQLARGDPRAAVRRLARGPVPARVGGVDFTVHYPSPREVVGAFAPEFRRVRTRGVGIFVPPSAAEPAISAHPRLLGALEALDRIAERPLALLGDHVLVHLERTAAHVTPRGSTLDSPATRVSAEALRRFRTAYAEHRASEGRGLGGGDEVRSLPYVCSGAAAVQWRVRARSFERFISMVLDPLAREVAPRPLHLLDLGAGNAWLSCRVRALGHRATAVDLRVDDIDGLGVLEGDASGPAAPPDRVAGSFEALPITDDAADIAVFNAAIHYALDLGRALAEACRVVRAGGHIVVIDSPFYDSAAHGEAMVAQKHARARAQFGRLAPDLLALPFIEFLTADGLARASEPFGLAWRRHRVRYPLGYELRPLLAKLRGRRVPSRFDVWEATAP